MTMFYERGFVGTALADVATDAHVTRGAVYHHFADKKELFEAVMERFEIVAAERVINAAAEGSDPWDAAIRSLDAFLEQCCDPVYGRIVWKEGPVALGFERWRECAEIYGFGLTREAVRSLLEAKLVAPAPLETMTRLVYAMIGEAGLALSQADEAEKAALRDEFRAVMVRMLEGLRITK